MAYTETLPPENQQQALDEAEVRFNEVLKSARHILYRLNAQKGGYDYMSPYFEELTGHPLSEFMKVSIERLPDYLHPEDRERIFGENGELSRAFRNRTCNEVHGLYEYRLRKADGSYCRLRDSNTAYFDDIGNLISFVGSVNDVSENFETREKLMASESLFRNLFDTMHEGFALHEVICDGQGDPIDYRFLDVNPAFEKLTGLRREAAVGRTVRELLPGIEDQWIRAFGRVALTGAPAELENYVKELGRYYRARAYSPQQGRFAVVFEDITAQKAAQKEQEEREKHLRVLLESSHAGIIQVGTTGLILHANRRMAEMFGCPLEGLIGSPYIDHLHPEHRQSGDDRMRCLIRGEIDHVAYERHYIRPDGSDFWGYLSGGRHQDESGNTLYLVGHIFDISERKQIELELAGANRKLRDSETLYRTLFEQSPDGIQLTDPDSLLPLYFNTAMHRQLGYSREEFASLKVSDFEQFDTREQIAARVESLRESGVVVFKSGYRTKQGTLLNVFVSLQMLTIGDQPRILAIVRDISEQMQAENAIRASEERFRATMALSPDIISIIGADGTLQYNSPAALHIHGYDQEEITGLNTFDLIHPDDRVAVNSAFQEVLQQPSLVKTVQYRYRNKDGSYAWMECAASNQLANPHINGVIAISRNIDDRLRMEEDRLKLEQQLLHAQKLESLGVLAGGIAHDFNNILTAIIGNAELARMRLNPESPGQENLQRIENAAARAADLARQMLAYSGKGTFVVGPIDLNRLVEEMGNMLEVSISKKAVLRFNFTTPLPAVNADSTQIRQIVMNLVINASEAIGDKNGIIVVSTGCLECTESYLQDVWLADPIPAGMYVFLEVADTGCGMDPETQSRIFDPFFTTKFTGRGLGMAAVLGIVRGHKGAIKVKSEPGKGSTFRVLLPAEEKPAALPEETTGSVTWHGCGTVLLVDDEESVRAIGAEMLRELGYEVITATDGRDALAQYSARKDIFLVILDLTMPHMDGEQCFRELRQVDPKVRVIISSGFSESEVIRKFAGNELSGFIQKPYMLSTLREALQSIVVE